MIGSSRRAGLADSLAASLQVPESLTGEEDRGFVYSTQETRSKDKATTGMSRTLSRREDLLPREENTRGSSLTE